MNTRLKHKVQLAPAVSCQVHGRGRGARGGEEGGHDDFTPDEEGAFEYGHVDYCVTAVLLPQYLHSKQ